MNDHIKDKECTVCNGTRISEPKLQNINDLGEGEGLDCQPIECRHCGGIEIEPE